MDIIIKSGEKIGQTLLRIGALKERHLRNILIRQQHGDGRKFGQIAVALRYINPEIMSHYLRAKNVSEHSARINRILYTPGEQNRSVGSGKAGKFILNKSDIGSFT